MGSCVPAALDSSGRTRAESENTVCLLLALHFAGMPKGIQVGDGLAHRKGHLLLIELPFEKHWQCVVRAAGLI